MKLLINLIFAVSVVSVVSVVAACSKDEAKNRDGKDSEGTPTTPAEPPKALANEGAAKNASTEATTKATTEASTAKAVMIPYEECRKKLAADDGDVANCATRIAAAAGAAKLDGNAAAKEAMKDIGAAATGLAASSGGNIEKLRVAFGEVSEPVEAMLTAIPTAAADYKMYECPMAKGFKRWAQPGKADAEVAMANPYMGTKMLTCGSEVHDHHGAAMNDMKGRDMKGHDMKDKN